MPRCSAPPNCRSGGASPARRAPTCRAHLARRPERRRALWQERTLVKTFGPRGPIHLLAPADLPVWTGALQALPSSVPTHPDGVRFTPGQAEEVIAAIAEALADAELTVDQL